MKPVTQRIIGVDGDGDCLMASAASILEISLDELPVIGGENDKQWFYYFDDAMRARGFAVIAVPNEPPLAPNGYTIAVGPHTRPNGSQESHAVVALDGHVVHDPHPTRTGIEHIEYFLILIPLARTPSRVTVDDTGPEGAF